MKFRSSSLVLACAALLSASSFASAQGQPAGDKKKALELYEKGRVQYDLRHWTQAVDLWMQAYEAYTAPEFLFNIAQAHRHQGNCEQALFFYRRYLAGKPDAKNRDQVEEFIAELEASCKGKAPAAGQREGTGTGRAGSGKVAVTGTAAVTGADSSGSGSGPKAGTGGTASTAASLTDPGGAALESGGGGRAGDVAVKSTAGAELDEGAEAGAERPHIFVLRAAVGPSFPSMGELQTGTLVSMSLGIGHPFYAGSVALEPGVLATYTPVPWEVPQDGTSGTAAMTAVIANAGVGLALLPGLSVRAEVGAGILVFSGLTADGNPFLDSDKSADGPISLFHARGALGIEYAITHNFVVHAEPVVVSISPSPQLRSDIDSIRQFEMLVGAGYTM